MNLLNPIRNTISWFAKLSLVLKILIILIVLAGGWFIYQKTRPSSAQVQYQTSQAAKGTIIVSVSASGQISNANSGSISTQASGVVTKVHVSNGQAVKQGDPIAEIELDQVGKQSYNQALSSYMSANNAVDSAEQTYYSLQADLYTKNKTFYDLATNSYYTNGDGSPNTQHREEPAFIVANDNWLAAEAKYKSQQNVVAQVKTSLSSSYLNYLEASPTVYAPISGVVTGLSLQIGSVLTNQTTSTGSITSQKIASIKTNAPPTVTINLTEVDVPNVSIGDKATVTLSAFPDKTFTGKVVSIDTVGSASSGVTTYPTTIQFDTEVQNIFANMSAEANIITDVADGHIVIPVGAVTQSNGESTVQVMKNGQVTTVPVTTGVSSDTEIQILSGIEEGETVVTSVTQPTTTQVRTTSVFSSFGGARGGAAGGNAVRISR